MSETEKDAGKAWLPLRCPRCGGELGGRSAGRFTCAYCGTSFLPGEVFAGKAVDLQKFYERAFAAMEEEAHDLAYEYFKRILETNAAEYQAWVGKGFAGAHAQLSDTSRLKPGEVLSCVDMALLHYDGDDEAAFQKQLGDLVGGLAVGLLRRIMRAGVNYKENLRALLDLMAYWEKHGSEELECWTATVAVAEKPAIRQPDPRNQGVLLLAPDYPFEKVAHEYSDKIRMEYDPAFKNAFERRAADRARWNEAFFSVAKTVLIVLLAFMIGGVVIVVCVILLIFFAALLSASVS